MKKTLKIFTIAMLLLFTSLLIFSCKDKNDNNLNYNIDEKNIFLEVNSKKKLEIYQKDNYEKLILDNKKFSFISDDEEVVKVNKEGELNALKNGNAKISVKIKDKEIFLNVIVGKISLLKNKFNNEFIIPKDKEIDFDVYFGNYKLKNTDYKIIEKENNIQIKNNKIKIKDSNKSKIKIKFKDFENEITVIPVKGLDGKFYASRTVKEMNNIKFEFDLVISNSKFELTRRKNNSFNGEDLYKGEIKYLSSSEILFIYNFNDKEKEIILDLINENKLVTREKLDVSKSGMKSELTFEKK